MTHKDSNCVSAVFMAAAFCEDKLTVGFSVGAHCQK